MTTLALLLIAACIYAAAVTALLVVALYGNSDLAAELRRERRDAEEAIALGSRLRSGYEAHVVDVINDNTRLRERLAAVEADVEQLGHLVLAVDAGKPLRAVRS